MDRHAKRMRLPFNDFYYGCISDVEEETVIYFLCQCSSLARCRYRLFGRYRYCKGTRLEKYTGTSIEANLEASMERCTTRACLEINISFWLEKDLDVSMDALTCASLKRYCSFRMETNICTDLERNSNTYLERNPINRMETILDTRMDEYKERNFWAKITKEGNILVMICGKGNCYENQTGKRYRNQLKK